MLKIMDIATTPAEPMNEVGRGTVKRFVDASAGTESLDVHINTLAPGGPNGRLHRHSAADNVYIVREGEGRLIVEGKMYTIRKDQVVLIPAGLVHSLSNVSEAPFEIVEIYAPAGNRFDFVVAE